MAIFINIDDPITYRTFTTKKEIPKFQITVNSIKVVSDVLDRDYIRFAHMPRRKLSTAETRKVKKNTN